MFLVQSEWLMRVLIRSPLETLHTPIVLSVDPDAKYFLFGENTTLPTVSEWPVSLKREHIDKLSILYIYNPSFYS